jgi:asparagine synthase (glutamine-hydrolysing)
LLGVVHFRGEAPSREAARRASELVALRGPDEHGIFEEGPALLFHHRNKVQPGGATQPIVGERFAVLLDGRLHDHIDFARSAFHVERADLSDAEVLGRAWETWGEGALERLDGEYAFALWDRRERRLFLARGPQGQRPLFYARQGDRVAFASLPTALARLPWVSRELAQENLAEYLSFRYVHAPRTLLREVKALQPGTLLSFGEGSFISRRFHTTVFASPRSPLPSDDEVLPELDRLIRKAVHRRLVPGEPTAVLFSGGLDASLVARAASLATPALVTWHLVLEGSGVNERSWAGRAASLLQAEHHEVHVDTDLFEDAFDGVVQAMGAPPPDPAAVLEYLLLKAVRPHHRVVLSGLGGDEALGGGRVAAAAKSIWKAEWLSSFKRAPLDLGRALLGRPALSSAPLSRLKVLGGTSVFDAALRRRVLRAGIDPRPTVKEEVLATLRAGLDTDALNVVMAVHQRGWLVEDALARMDRVAGAWGVDVRLPFLDQHLLRYLNLLPGSAKMRFHPFQESVTKAPGRLLLAEHFPDSLVHRPKMPMPSPLHAWTRGAGSEFIERRLEAVLDDRWGLWRGDAIRELAHAHKRGERNHGDAIWLLVMLDTWLEQLRAST